jgi:hypothetical protein
MRSFCLETKRTKKFKALPALPKTGFHCAGLAKLAPGLWGSSVSGLLKQ